jgi:hypothetical protein
MSTVDVSDNLVFYNVKVLTRNQDGSYCLLADRITHEQVPMNHSHESDKTRLLHAERGLLGPGRTADQEEEDEVRAKDIRDGLVDANELVGEEEAMADAEHPPEDIADSGAEEADAEEERNLDRMDAMDETDADRAFIDDENEPNEDVVAIARAIAKKLAKRPAWVPQQPLAPGWAENDAASIDGAETPPLHAMPEEDSGELEEEEQQQQQQQQDEPSASNRSKRDREDHGSVEEASSQPKRIRTEQENEEQSQADGAVPGYHVRGKAESVLLANVVDGTPGQILRFASTGVHFLEVMLNARRDLCVDAKLSMITIPPYCTRLAPDHVADMIPNSFHSLDTALSSDMLPDDFLTGMREAWTTLVDVQLTDVLTQNTVVLEAAAGMPNTSPEDGVSPKVQNATEEFFRKAAVCFVRSVARSVGHTLGHRAVLYAECLNRLVLAEKDPGGTLTTASAFCVKIIREALHYLGVSCGTGELADAGKIQSAMAELSDVGHDAFDHPSSAIQGFQTYLRTYPEGSFPSVYEMGLARTKYEKAKMEGNASAVDTLGPEDDGVANNSLDEDDDEQSKTENPQKQKDAPAAIVLPVGCSFGADWTFGLLSHNRRKLLALEVLRAKPGGPARAGKCATTLSSKGVATAGLVLTEELLQDDLDGVMSAFRGTIANVRKFLAAAQLRNIKVSGGKGGADGESTMQMREKWEEEMKKFAVAMFRSQRLRASAIRALAAKTAYWQFASLLLGEKANVGAMQATCNPNLWGPSGGILRGLTNLAPAMLRPDALPATLTWLKPSDAPKGAAVPPRSPSAFALGLWFAIVVRGCETVPRASEECDAAISKYRSASAALLQRVKDRDKFVWACRQVDNAMVGHESRANMHRLLLNQLICVDALVGASLDLRVMLHAMGNKIDISAMTLPVTASFAEFPLPLLVDVGPDATDHQIANGNVTAMLPAPGGKRWLCEAEHIVIWRRVVSALLPVAASPGDRRLAIHVDCSQRGYVKAMVQEAVKLARNGTYVVVIHPLAIRMEAELEIKAVAVGYVSSCTWDATALQKMVGDDCTLAVVGFPHASLKEMDVLATVVATKGCRLAMIGDARLGMLPIPGPRSSSARLFQTALDMVPAAGPEGSEATSPLDAILATMYSTAKRAVNAQDEEETDEIAKHRAGPITSLTDELDRHDAGLDKALASGTFANLNGSIRRLALGMLRSITTALLESCTCTPERKDTGSLSDGKVNVEVHWNDNERLLAKQPVGWGQRAASPALASKRAVYRVHGAVLNLLMVQGGGLPTTLCRPRDAGEGLAICFGSVSWSKFARVLLRLDVAARTGKGKEMAPPDGLLKVVAQMPKSLRGSDDFAVLSLQDVENVNYMTMEQILAEWVRHWSPWKLLERLRSLDEAPLMLEALSQVRAQRQQQEQQPEGNAM